MFVTICNITTINARQQTITFHRLCIECIKMKKDAQMKNFTPSPHSQHVPNNKLNLKHQKACE
jgi:hypothetical protein